MLLRNCHPCLYGMSSRTYSPSRRVHHNSRLTAPMMAIEDEDISEQDLEAEGGMCKRLPLQPLSKFLLSPRISRIEVPLFFVTIFIAFGTTARIFPKYEYHLKGEAYQVYRWHLSVRQKLSSALIKERFIQELMRPLALIMPQSLFLKTVLKYMGMWRMRCGSLWKAMHLLTWLVPFYKKWEQNTKESIKYIPIDWTNNNLTIFSCWLRGNFTNSAQKLFLRSSSIWI